ncbi:cryptic protein-like [Gastrophryne carolinensis]
MSKKYSLITKSVNFISCSGLAIQNETMKMAKSLQSLETHLERPARHFNHTKVLKQSTLGERIPFIGLTKTNTLDKHCCQNGGTCMLGNFCACPKHFSGRHCEFDMRSRHCGFVAHGHWLPRKCALCRCVYGVMYCFPSGDCDAHEYHEDVKMVQSKGPVIVTRAYLIILLTAIRTQNESVAGVK